MFRHLLIIFFTIFILFNAEANEKSLENSNFYDNPNVLKFRFSFYQNKYYHDFNLFSYDGENEEEYSDESGIGQAIAWAVLFPFAVGYAFANNNEYMRYPSEGNAERRVWGWAAFGGGLTILLTIFIVFLVFSIVMESFLISAIISTVLTGIYFVTSMISVGLYVDSVVNFIRYSEYYKEFCAYSFAANLGVLGFFAITAIIYWILNSEWSKIDSMKNNKGKRTQFVFDGQAVIFKF